MNWGSFSDFLNMGGYALYVWGSYLMTAVALGWEGVMLVQRRRRAADEARAWRLLNGDSNGDSDDPAP